MTKQTWRFSALDTWFFREARQMESFGGSELDSLFPPPARTVMGAIRTAMGEALGVDWRQYNEDEKYTIAGIPFREYIGYHDNTGRLSMDYPWLSIQRNGTYERLYPIPRNLFQKGIMRLRIGKPIHCDLGKAVRLPKLPKQQDKPKPLNGWTTQKGLEAFLAGEDISDSELFTDKRIEKELFQRESRLGIARDNSTRTAQEGMLYQTRHIRPNSNIAIEVDIEADYDRVLPPVKLIRLGGESRLAGITVLDTNPVVLNHPHPNANSHGVILTLLTPALFKNADWMLPDFNKVEQKDGTVWKGNLLGIDLTVHSAIIGKAQREGGWDMANHKPRPVTSLIPAGSLYYCTVD
ncbi:MAG TPA: type III-B CRISPR module-associated protein Cmr3, partial [Candidatus Aenigmarchaeota archaeon]|nr:type III-B CRISPR module-associated protein Cmr3 [Candidatus Aenigmarchaeota archaeon]